MPRPKTTTDTIEQAPAKRGRKKAPPPAEMPPTAPQQEPSLAEAERELIAKYSRVNIVPGSLRHGGPEGWGDKRIVTITCMACTQKRIVATSDIFHVAHCVECAKQVKKEARKAKKEVSDEQR
jgi:hypothetical protein